MNTKILLLLSAFALGSAVRGNLYITEVMSNSAHPGGTANGDWWELTNTGASAVDLTGYYWDDNGPAGNDGAIFPTFSLNPGSSVVIVDEGSANLLGFLDAWGGGFDVLSKDDFTGPKPFSGLGSMGDQIELWDADPNAGPANLVASVTFGASTNGVSFEWDTAGNSLGLSAIGENGAFQAINDGADPAGSGIDIASPGSAIPEPGVLALLGLSALLLHTLRRFHRV